MLLQVRELAHVEHGFPAQLVAMDCRTMGRSQQWMDPTIPGGCRAGRSAIDFVWRMLIQPETFVLPGIVWEPGRALAPRVQPLPLNFLSTRIECSQRLKQALLLRPGATERRQHLGCVCGLCERLRNRARQGRVRAYFKKDITLTLHQLRDRLRE